LVLRSAATRGHDKRRIRETNTHNRISSFWFDMAGQHASAHQGYFGSTRAVQHRALGYALDGFAKHWFTYAPALPQDAAPEAFGKVLRRRTRKIFLKNQPQRWFSPLRLGRLIIKDPIGALSSDWLARNFALESSFWCVIRPRSRPASSG
jgi:hypothetical protein